ncbi:hypothetical protein EJ08DRAFT_697264 [Tothia fuscella]|uniref:Uncharacterized protein n=1 Tax=Tothia fuscella TaxID=1048955 RepID=A0A9P4TYE4_9PEZI|nr:hypothetical protein EJ08DRAFT_697264 [Tothia fuscella]
MAQNNPPTDGINPPINYLHNVVESRQRPGWFYADPERVPHTTLMHLETLAEEACAARRWVEAERLLKELITTRKTMQEGRGCDCLDKWKLCEPLLFLSKFAEMEPLLREILNHGHLNSNTPDYDYDRALAQEIRTRRRLIMCIGVRNGLKQEILELAKESFRYVEVMESDRFRDEERLKLIQTLNRHGPGIVSFLGYRDDGSRKPTMAGFPHAAS